MQRTSTEMRVSDESIPKEVDLMPFISSEALHAGSVDNEEIITIHHVDHSTIRSQSIESSLLLLRDLKMTILVVDDSRLNRKMLIKCLQSDGKKIVSARTIAIAIEEIFLFLFTCILCYDWTSLPLMWYIYCFYITGHTCEEAEDGYGAIEKVKEKLALAPGGRSYDAILMDFVMPNMDGPTATKEIRAMGYTAPIFGVTGNGLPTDIDYFMSCGVNEVLLKPLNVADFYRSLKQPHY